jgi:hypothetical protein
VRVRATENPAGCAFASLDQSGKTVDALAAAQRSERELRSSVVGAEQVDAGSIAPITLALHESGISALAEQVAAVGSVEQAARVLLQRHTAVQSGKFDRGQQKAPWLRHDGSTARLTSQRNELSRGKHAQSWRNIGRHPYRTAAAGHFIQQCRIT